MESRFCLLDLYFLSILMFYTRRDLPSWSWLFIFEIIGHNGILSYLVNTPLLWWRGSSPSTYSPLRAPTAFIVFPFTWLRQLFGRSEVTLPKRYNICDSRSRQSSVRFTFEHVETSASTRFPYRVSGLYGLDIFRVECRVDNVVTIFTPVTPNFCQFLVSVSLDFTDLILKMRV